jgi:predicted signal transduction protein with EAL and GGDEF domain
LWILIPCLLIAGCLLRLLVWHNSQTAETSLEAVAQQFKVTTMIAPALGLLFISWTFSLYPYGDAAMRGQVAATFAVTAICNIYCLLHCPAASLILAAFTVPLFTGFLAVTGSQALMASGVDLFIVALCMCYMVLRSAQNFAQMITAQVTTVRLSDENSRLANSDMLTEFPNRRQFFDRLKAAYARHRDAGRFYVGAIDLDGFKPVNDIFGHIAGDRVLVECAARFTALAQGDADGQPGFFCRASGRRRIRTDHRNRRR